MKGFDPKFKDFPDYILGITREIWEDRGVGPALKRYYADDVIVRAPSNVIVGNDGVTAATLQTLHEFPDRQLVGEDVIWTGSEDDGFVSSHRLISVMHHQGNGAYGTASSALVKSRIIAECVVRDNQVVEEWLVRDQGAFASCLGMTARELAEQQVRQDLGQFGSVQFFTPEKDVAGPYVNQITDDREAYSYADTWQQIIGDKHVAALKQGYHAGASMFSPGGESLQGLSEIDRFFVSYLASFPDAEISIDHLMVNKQPGYPVRVAMRWSVQATHAGWGRFGAPTGAPVYIMGLSHAYLGGGQVLMEWVTIDEVAIWKQILAGSPDNL